MRRPLCLYTRCCLCQAALRARLLAASGSRLPLHLPPGPEWITAAQVREQFGLDSAWLAEHRRELQARRIVSAVSRKVRLYSVPRLRSLHRAAGRVGQVIHSRAAIPPYHQTVYEREGTTMDDTRLRPGDARGTPSGRRRRALSGEGMIVTTLAMHRAMHRRLTLAALDEHAVVAECMREAIEEWLARRATARSTRRGR